MKPAMLTALMLENNITKRYYGQRLKAKRLWSTPIDSNRKRYEEIRKLATRKGEDYSTGSLWMHQKSL